MMKVLLLNEGDGQGHGVEQWSRRNAGAPELDAQRHDDNLRGREPEGKQRSPLPRRLPRMSHCCFILIGFCFIGFTNKTKFYCLLLLANPAPVRTISMPTAFDMFWTTGDRIQHTHSLRHVMDQHLTCKHCLTPTWARTINYWNTSPSFYQLSYPDHFVWHGQNLQTCYFFHQGSWSLR